MDKAKAILPTHVSKKKQLGVQSFPEYTNDIIATALQHQSAASMSTSPGTAASMYLPSSRPRSTSSAAQNLPISPRSMGCVTSAALAGITALKTGGGAAAAGGSTTPPVVVAPPATAVAELLEGLKGDTEFTELEAVLAAVKSEVGVQGQGERDRDREGEGEEARPIIVAVGVQWNPPCVQLFTNLKKLTDTHHILVYFVNHEKYPSFCGDLIVGTPAILAYYKGYSILFNRVAWPRNNKLLVGFRKLSECQEVAEAICGCVQNATVTTLNTTTTSISSVGLLSSATPVTNVKPSLLRVEIKDW
ncbi:hypothetical protein Pelo_7820 [Pelomyxa schiedti]|nr:hypothetical protein Pelo_7820 [Pelomyxa schiedti]